MKKKNTLTAVVISIIFAVLSSSCLKDQFESIEVPKKEEVGYEGFDFATISSLDLTINTEGSDGKGVEGVVVEVFSSNPLLANGLYTSNANAHKIFKGRTTEDGTLNTVINCPTAHDSIFVLSHYVGLPALTALRVDAEKMEVTIGNKSNGSSLKSSRLKSAPPSEVNIVNGYYTLGNWNASGVPEYLDEINDVVTSELLEKVNASLPERNPLTNTHPQYLNSSFDANLNVSETCEVWVTFVHEGAGWTNTLGYYTYPIGNPPSSVDDINDLTIIFPNVSYAGSGGGLNSGNKVQLHYLNQETQEYTNIFPANTSIGWFIVAQGWRNGTVSNGVYSHFSDIALNNEADPDLKKHNVLLYDEANELLLMGFEDIRRDRGSDEDFNDAVFYTTITPFTAVNTAFYQPIDTPTDSDGDGVSDTFDEFPNDENRAFNNHYPAENTYGTLIFEDLWPYKGDYDFNDLVIDYNFTQLTNSDNEITGIDTRLVVRAIGASYH
ncbi:MAG: LruC domain-containing protein, partial [Carboxylicivirga sp.]|nr:LruC domain-containing protein [Carboxylicivirga sp.]